MSCCCTEIIESSRAIADELRALADDIDQSSGTCEESQYLRMMIARWDNAIAIYQNKGES